MQRITNIFFKYKYNIFKTPKCAKESTIFRSVVVMNSNL